MPSGGIGPISILVNTIFERRSEVQRVIDIGVGFG
jgi:hypothetical protein